MVEIETKATFSLHAVMARRNLVVGVSLIGITLLGIVLRVWGLHLGLPYAESRPDELTVVSKAMGFGGGDLNPHFFNYPSLIFYVLFVMFGLHAVVLFAVGAIHSTKDILVGFAADPTAYYLLARSLSAVAGALTVPAVYVLTRQVSNRLAALMAALFMAVMYLHVRDSHFGVTDVPMTAMIVVTAIFVMRIFRDGRRRDCVLAGISMGLASGLKYNAALLAFPILLAHWWAPTNRDASFKHRFFSRNLWLAGLCAAGCFIVSSPFVVLDWRTFLRDFSFEMRHLTGVGEASLERGWIVHWRLSLWYGAGPLMLFSALAGAGAAVLRKPRQALVLAAFPLIYYIAIGRGFTVFVRYALPVTPFIAVFAGVLFGEEIPAWLRKHHAQAFGLALGGIGALAIATLPLSQSVAFDRLISRTDTRTMAAEFVQERCPSGTMIGWIGTRYGLPRFRETTASLARQLEQTRDEGNLGRFLDARLKVAMMRGDGVEIRYLDPQMLTNQGTCRRL